MPRRNRFYLQLNNLRSLSDIFEYFTCESPHRYFQVRKLILNNHSISSILRNCTINFYFSNTYQLIESEANKIWKSDKYHLVYSFYYKPLLPAPLIIFSYMLSLIQFVIRHCVKLTNYDMNANKVMRALFGYNKTGFGKN